MRKLSVYLDHHHVEQLRRAADAEGRSQAEILRDGIVLYTGQTRSFAMDGVTHGPGRSIADLTEEEMPEGFGE